MKPGIVITLGVIVLLLALVYVLNRPQLNTITAPIPRDFPDEGFSHQVFERLLQTYVDAAGDVDYDAWHANFLGPSNWQDPLLTDLASLDRLYRPPDETRHCHYTGCDRVVAGAGLCVEPPSVEYDYRPHPARLPG